MNIVDEKRKQIATLCQKYAVRTLYLFGSAIRKDFNRQSDIDLAVVFLRNGITGSFDQYFDFKIEMEQLLGRTVDLVCASNIRNKVFRQQLDETKRLIYAA